MTGEQKTLFVVNGQPVEIEHDEGKVFGDLIEAAIRCVVTSAPATAEWEVRSHDGHLIELTAAVPEKQAGVFFINLKPGVGA